MWDEVERAGLDPRLTPARPDLAAAFLRGRIQAPRYVEGRATRVRAASADLRRGPRRDEGLETELLHGEVFTVYDETEGWAWGQAEVDGYVGYAPAEALVSSQKAPSPTHKVAVLRTLIFPEPNIKSTPVMGLSLGAALAVASEADGFARLAENGFAIARHLVPIGHCEPDCVQTAALFLGTPYYWGGRTGLGIDCSGLVQLALSSAGIAAPRDTDLQAQSIGSALPEPVDPATLRRGDLVFWRGHVALVYDRTQLIHANAFHMAVAIEPVAEAVRRIAENTGTITTVRRPKAPCAGGS